MKSLLIFIFDTIKELGSPVNDRGVIESKQKAVQNIQNSAEYSTFLPEVFKEIMERLDHLQASVEMIQTMK